MKNFKDRVYSVVSKIPKGRVLSYAEVARRAASPGAARAVGSAMRNNPHPASKVPCHRVIKSDGSVGEYGRGGAREKIRLLKSEGVVIKNNRVVF